MSYGEIDIEDALAGNAFALSAAITNGLATISIMGYDLAQSLFVLEGETISAATVISVAALAIAYGTNRVHGPSQQEKDAALDTDLNAIAKGDASMETYLALGTILIIGVTAVNLFGAHDYIVSNTWAGIVVLAVEAAGYYVISYLG